MYVNKPCIHKDQVILTFIRTLSRQIFTVTSKTFISLYKFQIKFFKHKLSLPSLYPLS